MRAARAEVAWEEREVRRVVEVLRRVFMEVVILEREGEGEGGEGV